MINWNDNAEAAVREFADWFLTGYAYLAEVDKFLSEKRPTQTKTVAGAEQEGEWTHTIDGLKVRFLVDGPDEAGEVPVVAEDGYYRIFDVDQLKPIKPTISESDAKALEIFANKSHRHSVAWAVKEYLSGHDII